MAYSLALGQHGFKRIADTKTHHSDLVNAQNGSPGTDDGTNEYHDDVRKFVAIVILDVTTAFDSGTEMGGNSDAPNASDTFLQGQIIYGPFRKIQLSAGSVYAYFEG